MLSFKVHRSHHRQQVTPQHGATRMGRQHKNAIFLIIFLFAGSLQANDALVAELSGLTQRIATGYEQFLNQLNQWSNGAISDDQALLAMPPMTHRLSSDFQRLSQIAGQLTPYANAATGETGQLQNLQALGNQGAQGFGQWHWLFSEVKQAKDRGDSASASQLLQQYYPTLLNGTLVYAQQLAALGQQQNTPATPAYSAAVNATPSQAELLQMQQNMQTQQQYYQTMSNINNMMHDTNMSIINNMGSSATTDYYENGTYIGSW
jgi:hypothetical protein